MGLKRRGRTFQPLLSSYGEFKPKEKRLPARRDASLGPGARALDPFPITRFTSEVVATAGKLAVRPESPI
jgi:hypothetical protein